MLKSEFKPYVGKKVILHRGVFNGVQLPPSTGVITTTKIQLINYYYINGMAFNVSNVTSVEVVKPKLTVEILDVYQ
jgi:hypothetical protein